MMNKVELRQNEENIPEKKLLPYAGKKATEIILKNNCPIHDTFLIGKMDGDSFTAKSENESIVLDGHLRGMPIVPGVIQKGLLLKRSHLEEKVYSGKLTIETLFGTPVQPGNTIIKSKRMLALSHDNEDESLSITMRIVKTPEIDIDKKFNESLRIDLNKEMLDRKLLQCKGFRFVSGVAYLERDSKDEISILDTFQGHYSIPADFRFVDKNGRGELVVTPYIIEEMAAQIGVTAYSEKLGEVIDKNNTLQNKASIMTFDSSTCRFSGTSLKPGDEFRLIGRIIGLNERGTSFEYIGCNQHGEKIIEGKISGNMIMIYALNRMLRRLKSKDKAK